MPTLSAVFVPVLFLTFTIQGFGQSPIERFSRCKLGGDFEIVQVDRLPGTVTRSLQTPVGPKEVVMTDGYRILITYQNEPFVNLKAEQFDKARYSNDKQSLIDSLGPSAKGTPNSESEKPAKSKMGRFESYAINRTKLEGGVLSMYLWFDDSDAQVLTAYILNDEPAARKFKTIDEYRDLRDRFLQKLSGCDAH